MTLCVLYLASQHKHSVDVRQDAMKTEVDVRTDQREDRWEDTGARMELQKENTDMAAITY